MGEKITDKDYEQILKIWNTFELKTKYYHNLHLKYDVLLLADVFEKFRNSSLYLSMSALSWDYNAQFDKS